MTRLLLAVFTLFTFSGIAQNLPEDFSDQLVSQSFDAPLGIVWAEDGTAYVWEKAGRVWQVDTNGVRYPEPLVDISEEVGNFRDMGMLGFALDPEYDENGHLYLLYVAERHHVLYYGTDEYHPDSSDYFNASLGRVTRYTADPATEFTTLKPDSRKVLIGNGQDLGIALNHESHSVGTLVFGTDGTLLVSTGDGSSFNGPDHGGDAYGSYALIALDDGMMRPEEDLGAYRSQAIFSQSGKILRIDPETGAGIPSNPYFEESDPTAPRSRVWTTGLRNPFRMAIRPETGSHQAADGDPGALFVGDVGASDWEELNVVTAPGQNFGWPLTEGYFWRTNTLNLPVLRNEFAPNPLAGDGCPEYFNFQHLLIRPGADTPVNPCNTLQEMPASPHLQRETLPAIAWTNDRHSFNSPATVGRVQEDGTIEVATLGSGNAWVEGEDFSGYSSMAGTFYHDGNFPEEYEGTYFHVDFSGWIKVMRFDDQHQLLSVEPFYEDADTDLLYAAQHPTDGCLYYLTLNGDLRKICYGGNPLPVVRLEADVTYGPGDLTVQFDATESYAPFGHPVEYFWEFGDGTTSTEATPQHEFLANGNDPTSYTVILTVTDTTETSNSATQLISLNNTPPQVNITSIQEGDRYPMDKAHLLRFEAAVNDDEHPQEELRYEWQAFLHHNAHFHKERPDSAQVAFGIISPNGCEEAENYWYRVRLTVTDGEGLQGMDEKLIYPNCEGFAAVPDLIATPTESLVRLNWDVPAGDWSDFELQRSEDQLTYSVLLQNSGEIATHNDVAPPRGDLYYRLKFRDQQGNYGYSAVRQVRYPVLPEVLIYPNPTAGNVLLRIENPATEIGLVLYDALGRQVVDLKWETTTGDLFETSVGVGKLESGIYFYRVLNGGEEIRGTLVRR